LYAKRPNPAELAELGLTLEDFDDDFAIELWTCNREAFDVFCAMSTQWNVGSGGPVGLSYPALYGYLDRTAGDRWQSLFDDVRVMEIEALSQMRENK
jgi:Phage related hypothetical protein (DUF1799)